MTNNRITNIIKKLEDHSVISKSENKNSSPTILDILIATKLSQNTTDKTSYKAFMNLKENFKTWEELIEAPLQKIKNAIKVCGLANTKSRQIKQMLREMKRKYGNLDLSFLKKMDNEKIYEELLQYNGIGVKTVSCVLAFSLDRNVFPVDTHVHRVLNRLGIVNTKTAEQTFETASKKIPKENQTAFHTNLIKFGRNICKANKPLCNLCFLYRYCSYEYKNLYKDKTSSIKKENNFIILENV
ncbi:endonuclease III domain-containing protein [Bacteroidota bacterium]